MNDYIIKSIIYAILGCLFGYLCSWIYIRYKKMLNKKNILKHIKKQKIQSFLIPKIKKGERIQYKVNLSKYCEDENYCGDLIDINTIKKN